MQNLARLKGAGHPSMQSGSICPTWGTFFSFLFNPLLGCDAFITMQHYSMPQHLKCWDRHWKGKESLGEGCLQHHANSEICMQMQVETLSGLSRGKSPLLCAGLHKQPSGLQSELQPFLPGLLVWHGNVNAPSSNQGSVIQLAASFSSLLPFFPPSTLHLLATGI